MVNKGYYERVKKAAACVLNLIDPKKPYGTELFDAISRVTISVGIEAVCLRRNPKTNEIEVLLTQRSPHETAYPNEWHAPGSIMRPGESEENVFNRLSRYEFGTEITSKKFVGHFNNIYEERGHIFSLVYLCSVEEGSKGIWYPIDQLPLETVEHHRNKVIPMATKAFRGQ